MAETKLSKHKPPWVVILNRFSGNKMGIVGTILILCLVFVAVFDDKTTADRIVYFAAD